MVNLKAIQYRHMQQYTLLLTTVITHINSDLFQLYMLPNIGLSSWLNMYVTGKHYICPLLGQHDSLEKCAKIKPHVCNPPSHVSHIFFHVACRMGKCYVGGKGWHVCQVFMVSIHWISSSLAVFS